ncbi:MAG TPA: hypothetical protein VLI71_00510 [Gammaproteobacteria bacterium]|nr:hypothetical protein [Gammaproteobacteria bacterium]
MALDYFDKLAEVSVKEAIQQLLADGKRPSSRTVPNEARQVLRLKGRGRVTEIEAEKRVQQAIERMRNRKEIKAPKAGNGDWALIDQAAKSATETK